MLSEQKNRLNVHVIGNAVGQQEEAILSHDAAESAKQRGEHRRGRRRE